MHINVSGRSVLSFNKLIDWYSIIVTVNKDLHLTATYNNCINNCIQCPNNTTACLSPSKPHVVIDKQQVR